MIPPFATIAQKISVSMPSPSIKVPRFYHWLSTTTLPPNSWDSINKSVRTWCGTFDLSGGSRLYHSRRHSLLKQQQQRRQPAEASGCAIAVTHGQGGKETSNIYLPPVEACQLRSCSRYPVEDNGHVARIVQRILTDSFKFVVED